MKTLMDAMFVLDLPPGTKQADYDRAIVLAGTFAVQSIAARAACVLQLIQQADATELGADWAFKMITRWRAGNMLKAMERQRAELLQVVESARARLNG